MCARSLKKLAKTDSSLAEEHVLELLQHCLLGLKLAHSDSPGMSTCSQFADAIKVGNHNDELV